jgi:DDE superfamily endonuclease/Helix-turn-helix of DDE superfamily endonuclease
MINYKQLKSQAKTFVAVTGLRVEEFEKMLPTFQAQYEQAYPADRRMDGEVRQRQAGAGRKPRLAQIEDKLLFILSYHKHYPLQTLHALQFGMSQGRANEWIQRLLPILQATLEQLGMAPERQGAAVASSPLAQAGGPDLAIDGTERRRVRPSDPEKQKAHYSGKKKTHTVKNVIVSNIHSGKVVYLSPSQPGCIHDKKLSDQCHLVFPDLATLSKDTGFQGYEPPDCLTLQPKKAKRFRSECE